MTTRTTITIRGQADRDRLAEMARTMAVGMRVDIKQERRSNEQNSKFWAMLGEVAEQTPWHGVKMSAEEWKYLFLDAYKREVRIVPNIDGNGFVSIGRSSSDLSVAEMADVITLIEMFGANHGVKFNEPEISDSSGAQSRANSQAKPDDAPAVVTRSPPTAETAAGVHYPEEVSLLSPDWRHQYVVCLAVVRDQAASLLTRHSEAVQMVGGEPHAGELGWMRDVWRLVQKRNEGKLKRGEYDTEIGKLKTGPLPATKDAA